MSIAGLLTKRPWWPVFGICQVTGFAAALLIRNEIGMVIAFLLLAPGSLVAAIPLMAIAFAAGALPVWARVVAVPVVVISINFALWSAVDSLRTKRATGRSA